jgi:hypothetical protein
MPAKTKLHRLNMLVPKQQSQRDVGAPMANTVDDDFPSDLYAPVKGAANARALTTSDTMSRSTPAWQVNLIS